jgi:hypothetical protein
MPDHALNIGCRDGTLGAGNTNPASQLLTIKLLTRAILLDDERCGQYRPFVTAEALTALQALAAAANPSMTVMGSIEHF